MVQSTWSKSVALLTIVVLGVSSPAVAGEADGSSARDEASSEAESSSEANSKSASRGEGESAEAEPSVPPVNVSGQAMFRYTWSLDPDDRNSAEIYNLRLFLKRSFQGVTLYAEPRFRQTPLRSFSPSNVWIQEAWASFDKYADSVGTAKAGLIYSRLGLPWDDSWFGNLVYLNGLKLDPDYGLEMAGGPSVWSGNNRELKLKYGLQYFPVEDGLNGFFAPDFKLDALGATPSEGVPLDFDSAPNHLESNVLVAEVGPQWKSGPFQLRATVSGMTKSLDRLETESRSASSGRQYAYGVDLEATWHGLSAHAEVLREEVTGFGRGGTRMDHGLAGIRWRKEWKARTWLRALEARTNVSGVSYRRADAREWFVAPAVHLRLHRLAGVTAEYVRWEFDGRRVVNRVEWILHGYF